MMNFAGSIADFFLKNKPLSKLVFVAIIVLGIFGFIKTPKQYNPEIILPAFEIQIPYEGATAKEVSDHIIYELEEKIAEIPGVDNISSVAVDGGMAITRVEFLVGENLEESKIKLYTKIYGYLDQKTGNIGDPIIKNITPDDVAIIVFAFTADDLTENELRAKIVRLSRSLQKAKGVSNINVYGGQPKALKVILDPEKLKLWHLSVQDVAGALEANVTRYHFGYLETEDELMAIDIDPEIIDADNAKNILLGSGITLGDVAKIEDGYLEDDSYSYYYQKGDLRKEAIYLGIAKKKGENSSITANSVFDIFETEIKKNDYEGIEYKVVRDDAKKASDEIAGLGGNLISSIVIVAMVLFFFLGLRSAFVVAMAIPLTLFLVFFIGYLFDQTINRITLFALILSLGLLVDSATVVVENIFRYYKEKDGDKKIPIAISEIGIGLLLSTLTSVIVFLPMRNITGMMGPYMGPVTFFVPIALIVSLLIAYTITPFLSSMVLKKDDKSRPLFGKLFDYLSEKYAKILDKVLRNRKLQNKILIITFGLLFLVFSFPIFKIVHFQMLPKSNQNQVFITIDLPEGTSSAQTKKVADNIEELAISIPEATASQNYIASKPVIDFNGLYRGFSERNQKHQATIKVNLEPMGDKRDISTEEVAMKLRDQIYAKYPRDGQIKIRIIEEPPGPPVMSTFVAKIKGSDSELREKLAREVEDKLYEVSGITDIDTSIEEPVKKFIFKIDEERAKDNGLNTFDIQNALALIGGEKAIIQFHPKEADEMAFVELSFPDEYRQQEDLQHIYIKNNAGEILPIKDFVTIEESLKTKTIYFDEREPTTYITAEIEQRSIIYAMIDMMSALLAEPPDGLTRSNWNLFGFTYLDPNTGEKYMIEWGGEFKMTLENFRDLGLAMIIAFFLIYAILVAQFESFKVPVFIMVTIFLAFLGIIPGFAILENTSGDILTATALIGFIALMGIVVNNAIIFLEYLDILLAKKMSVREALVEAGKTRLRPIVLTSMTTVLGSLTIASDPVWSGLAWTIVFGLSLSTFLTLGIFPILYLRDKEKRHKVILK